MLVENSLLAFNRVAGGIDVNGGAVHARSDSDLTFGFPTSRNFAGGNGGGLVPFPDLIITSSSSVTTLHISTELVHVMVLVLWLSLSVVNVTDSLFETNAISIAS